MPSEDETEALRAENGALRAEITGLRAEVAELRAGNARLGGKIAELEARLKKGSRNSSLPPSTDRPGQAAEARRSRAERRAEARASAGEGRRRGKQPGAPGGHLARRSDPDEVVAHEPECCARCGGDLADAPIAGVEARQVTDVPDPRPVVTEHRSVKRRCGCGAVSAGRFPPEARAPACYGPNTRAMALYLLHRQHLPVERAQEALRELLGVEVSTGFLASLAPEAAGRLAGFTEALKARLAGASLLHVDETTDQVGGKTVWLHVAANDDGTYLFASPTRGRAAPDAAGVLGGFTGTMVHDRLAMYFGYDKAAHAVCGAHLLRDLESVALSPSQRWAKQMRGLLLDMNAAAHAARGEGRSSVPRGELAGLLRRYDALVADALAANRPLLTRERNSLERESSNLALAFERRRAEITRFVVDLSVPFTNNEAERSLRMAKLHRKISGCFQSEAHARHFATIRSYLDTARKHGARPLDVLTRLFRSEAWVPPAVT